MRILLFLLLTAISSCDKSVAPVRTDTHTVSAATTFKLEARSDSFKYVSRGLVEVDSLLIARVDSNFFSKVSLHDAQHILSIDSNREYKVNSYFYYSLLPCHRELRPALFLWNSEGNAICIELVLFDSSDKPLNSLVVGAKGGEGGEWGEIRSYFDSDSTFSLQHITGADIGFRDDFALARLDSTSIRYLMRTDGRLDTFYYFKTNWIDSAKVAHYGS